MPTQTDFPDAPRVPTSRFALRNHVQSGSVIKAVCLTGGYHGVVPTKLASGRWDWPDVAVKKQKVSAMANDASNSNGPAKLRAYKAGAQRQKQASPPVDDASLPEA